MLLINITQLSQYQIFVKILYDLHFCKMEVNTFFMNTETRFFLKFERLF